MAYQVGLRHQASLGPTGGLAGGAVAILVAVALTASAAFATENGRNPFPLGTVGIGVGDFPPPGFYMANEFLHVRSDRFNGSNGKKIPAFQNFETEATAYAPRFLYNPGIKFLGGDLLGQIVFPFVRVSFKNPTPGPPFGPPPGTPPASAPPFGRQTRSGLADIAFTPFIAWHTPNFHYAVGIDFNIPTASFEPSRLVNLGLGYVAISPAFGFTYRFDGFELSSKLTVDINFENPDTKYDSGEAGIIDLLFGRQFEASWGRVLAGIGGFYYHQFNDDKTGTPPPGFDGFRGRELGLGPEIQYQHPIGAIAEFKYFKSVIAENRAESDRFIFRVLFRLAM